MNDSKAKIVLSIKYFFIFLLFILIWVNIPILFPKCVNLEIFSFGVFNVIPEEYKFLQNDEDNFTIVDLDLISNNIANIRRPEVYKYFYKKDQINDYQAEVLFDGLPVNPAKSFNKQTFTELGKQNIKYVLVHFNDETRKSLNLLNVDGFGELIDFPGCVVIKNKFFVADRDVVDIQDLIYFYGGQSQIEGKLIESISMENFELVLKPSNNSNDVFSGLRSVDYLIPLSLNNVDSAEIKDSYKAFFELVEDHYKESNVIPGEKFNLEVYIYNLGNKTWLPEDKNPINISYHIYDAETDETVIYDGVRTGINFPVIPGEKIKTYVRVHMPKSEGLYFLSPDLVKENEFWFSQLENYSVENAVKFELSVQNNKKTYKLVNKIDPPIINEIFLKYKINIPVEGYYYLIVNNNEVNNRNSIDLSVNNKKVLINGDGYIYDDILPGYWTISKIYLSKGDNSLIFKNLNFLNDENGLRLADYLYLISANNFNYKNSYQIVESKNKNGYLSKLKVRVDNPMLLKVYIDRKFNYELISDSSNTSSIYLLQTLTGRNVVFIKDTGLYSINFDKKFRIQKIANTFNEYIYYEN